MKVSNIKGGDKVYFKTDKYKLKNMYYTGDDGNIRKSLIGFNNDEKRNIKNVVEQNKPVIVDIVYKFFTGDNEISVNFVSGEFDEVVSVDAKFFRSEK